MNQSNPFDPPRSFAQQGGDPAAQPGQHPGAQPPQHPGQHPQQHAPGFQHTPPPPPPSPEPRRRSWFARHKILTGLGVLAVVIVVAAVAGGGGQDDPDDAAAPPAGTEATSSAPEQTEEPEQAAPEVPGIGAPARDGKFEFTVTSVEAGVPMIGNDVLGEQAQGQFVLVHVTVANIGDEAQSFLGDNATLVDDQGREHSADSTAALYLDGAESFFTEINPGNAVDAVVVFDVPADAVPTALELHDSMFSGGVTVALS